MKLLPRCTTKTTVRSDLKICRNTCILPRSLNSPKYIMLVVVVVVEQRGPQQQNINNQAEKYYDDYGGKENSTPHNNNYNCHDTCTRKIHFYTSITILSDLIKYYWLTFRGCPHTGLPEIFNLSMQSLYSLFTVHYL